VRRPQRFSCVVPLLRCLNVRAHTVAPLLNVCSDWLYVRPQFLGHCLQLTVRPHLHFVGYDLPLACNALQEAEQNCPDSMSTSVSGKGGSESQRLRRSLWRYLAGVWTMVWSAHFMVIMSA